ncbi:toll/interleukin-1 receptor domain-containing protein [Methylobacterium sp. WL64]|uniref:toll/interleukin-1 receptor domain-containing protein n=1 Tax=Methylobacterium sp. WL64 TaxID=2603894 RepID=UPI001FEE4034|nr:toll/interleukin-1 receptor domain-containing protein [Methylobacterium sp. WL64]
MPSKPTAPKAKAKKATVRIFVSYSHANVVQQAKLQIHLAQLKRDEVETWFDDHMAAGDKLSTEISRNLREADIFVALMSPEYLASRWCQLEYNRAMGRRAKGLLRVVVVVVRPCAWKDTGASDLKALPRDGRSVIDWRSMDHAFADVAEGIKGTVRAVRASMPAKARATNPNRARPASTAKAEKPRAMAKVASRVPAKARVSPKEKGPTRGRAAK